MYRKPAGNSGCQLAGCRIQYRFIVQRGSSFHQRILDVFSGQCPLTDCFSYDDDRRVWQKWWWRVKGGGGGGHVHGPTILWLCYSCCWPALGEHRELLLVACIELSTSLRVVQPWLQCTKEEADNAQFLRPQSSCCPQKTAAAAAASFSNEGDGRTAAAAAMRSQLYEEGLT